MPPRHGAARLRGTRYRRRRRTVAATTGTRQVIRFKSMTPSAESCPHSHLLMPTITYSITFRWIKLRRSHCLRDAGELARERNCPGKCRQPFASKLAKTAPPSAWTARRPGCIMMALGRLHGTSERDQHAGGLHDGHGAVGARASGRGRQGHLRDPRRRRAGDPGGGAGAAGHGGRVQRRARLLVAALRGRLRAAQAAAATCS